VHKPDDLAQTYNKIAQDWHSNHQTDLWWKPGTDTFISLLPPKPLVLDVGCGDGNKATYLIQRGVKVVGIDSSEEMIKIATEEAPDGKFLILDIRNIDQLRERFNGIYLQAVLLHLPKKEISAILTKLLTKLKKGGILYATVKEIRPLQPEEEIKTENDYGYTYERFFSYFNLDEIKHLLEQAKLNIISLNLGPNENTNWIEAIAKK
jgi:SAM-dependent methyltransferase